MTPFLEYELLSPETADPVIIRITGQRERGFEDFEASNGVWIRSVYQPSYARAYTKELYTRGDITDGDNRLVTIPVFDWPAVKQAIRELNNEKAKEAIRELIKDAVEDVETWPDWKKNFSLLATCSTTLEPRVKKEKDMKEDRYEFPLNEWQYDTEPEPFELPEPTKLIVTRKKPKVEDRENIPVKVEWSNCSRFGDGMGENGIDFTRYGYERYHLVQFRVTGYSWGRDITFHASPCKIHLLSNDRYPTEYNSFYGIEIRPDARERWSPPVLLPESIYSKLDEICRALEEKANEVKG